MEIVKNKKEVIKMLVGEQHFTECEYKGIIFSYARHTCRTKKQAIENINYRLILRSLLL